MLSLIFWIQKQVFMTLRPVICCKYILSFISWIRNQVLQPTKSQVHTRVHILGGKIGITTVRPGTGHKYRLYCIFWVRKQVAVTNPDSNTHCSLFFRWKNRDRWLARPQVHLQLHITIRIITTAYSYMSGFIFWVEKQVCIIGQASGTHCS